MINLTLCMPNSESELGTSMINLTLCMPNSESEPHSGSRGRPPAPPIPHHWFRTLKILSLARHGAGPKGEVGVLLRSHGGAFTQQCVTAMHREIECVAPD